MAWLLVCSVALAASALTLFSGFGLGTLLLPAFAVFFPIETAVAATAIVHLANNLFKLALVGRHADRSVVLHFGLPALLGAAGGAWILGTLASSAPLLRYRAFTRELEVHPVNLVIASLILVFAIWELRSDEGGPTFSPTWIPAGGLLSGFFGGLSGHQGAMRSAFLLQSGLSRDAFIGTGVTCAVLVDLARLGIYGRSWIRHPDPAGLVGDAGGLVIAATLSAFVGAFLGARMMKKVTLVAVRRLVGAMLILLAVALGSGWI